MTAKRKEASEKPEVCMIGRPRKILTLSGLKDRDQIDRRKKQAD